MDNKQFFINYSENLTSFKMLRKNKFINFFSILSPIIFIIYCFLHLIIEKDIFMASFCFFVSFTFVLNFLFYLKYKNSKIKKILSVSLILAMILLFLEIIKGNFNNAGIMWTAPFPIFAYYLKGKKNGTVYVFIFLLICAFFIILNYFFKFFNTYPVSSYFHALIIFIFITLLTNFYEETNEENEKLIIDQLYNDSLTGLPNRTKLLNDINIHFNELTNYHLILININTFKTINNIYGSKIGDKIIIEISDRLKLYNAIDNIYKLNFDEFGLIFKNQTENIKIEEHIKNINQLLKREYNIANHEILLSFTFGVSDKNLDILLNADMALKHAKLKKISYFFYKNISVDDEKNENKIIIINKLKHAIIYDNIIPYYQPIFNNITNKIDEYECLLRIKTHDEIMLPVHFLHLAKSSKIYPHLTKIMFLKSIETFKDKNYNFSLNITNEDIFNEESIDFVFNLVKDYDIFNKLIIELVESEELEQNDQVLKTLKKFKDQGCKLAIDDFGSGYSNFNYLLRINIDYLKIDSSLIKNINSDKNSQIITETIVDFCKKLNIKTVAEYIHNKEVYDKVKELGIDYSQGFYLGKPESFIEI